MSLDESSVLPRPAALPPTAVPAKFISPPVAAGSATRSALLLAFAAIYLIWGSTYLAIRVAVETMPPFLAAGARFVVAGLLVSVWLVLKGRFRATPRQWLANAWISALLLAGGNGIVMWAEQKIPSGITTLLISCSPLSMVLMEWLALKFSPPGAPRGAKPSLATMVGVALGLAGLLLLIGGSLSGGAGGLDLWRVGGILFGCFSWSLGALCSRYAREPAEPLTAATIQMLCGGALMLLVGLVLGEARGFAFAALSGRSWLAWGYLVGAGSLVAYPCYVWLLKHSSPALVSTYAYVNPIVAVFLGWLLLSEPVTSRTFLAAAVIIAAVAIITGQKSKAAKR